MLYQIWPNMAQDPLCESFHFFFILRVPIEHVLSLRDAPEPFVSPLLTIAMAVVCIAPFLYTDTFRPSYMWLPM